MYIYIYIYIIYAVSLITIHISPAFKKTKLFLFQLN